MLHVTILEKMLHLVHVQLITELNYQKMMLTKLVNFVHITVKNVTIPPFVLNVGHKKPTSDYKIILVIV